MDVVMTLALGSKLQKFNNKSYHCSYKFLIDYILVYNI